VVDPSNQFNSFEYWPNGDGSEKIEFLVEMHFGMPFQLRFHEKGKANSPVLILTLSYTEE
jgi:hypothetical protein